MRAAPPVQAWSCSTGPWRAFQSVLHALAAAVAAAWIAGHLWGNPAAAASAVAALLLTAVIARRWPAAQPCRLGWDGGTWLLQPARGEAIAGQARVMIDLGAWMLVRFAPGARWLPLARGDSADWQALRVALHAVRPEA